MITEPKYKLWPALAAISDYHSEVYATVLRDNRITPGAFRLWCYLCEAYDTQLGYAWLNPDTIATTLHATKPIVARWIEELEKAGWLEVKPVPSVSATEKRYIPLNGECDPARVDPSDVIRKAACPQPVTGSKSVFLRLLERVGSSLRCDNVYIRPAGVAGRPRKQFDVEGFVEMIKGQNLNGKQIVEAAAQFGGISESTVEHRFLDQIRALITGNISVSFGAGKPEKVPTHDRQNALNGH